jgi:hypothetical protein
VACGTGRALRALPALTLLNGNGVQIRQDPRTPPALHLHRVGPQVFDHRRAHGLAVPDTEFALVQRAFDFKAVKEAIAQARMPMGADVVGRIPFPCPT